LCRELGISRQLLYGWREQAERAEQKRFLHTELRLRAENARLKKLVVEKSLEADFFKGALHKIEALRRSGSGSGATASGPKSGN
jgi:transposase-like protein